MKKSQIPAFAMELKEIIVECLTDMELMSAPTRQPGASAMWALL